MYLLTNVQGVRQYTTVKITKHIFKQKILKKISDWMMNECGCKLLNSESKTSLNLVGYLKKFSHDDDEK